MPVLSAGRPIGYAMIGQFCLSGLVPAAHTDRPRAALADLPVFTHRKSEDLLSLFRVLIEHIAAQSLVGRRRFDLLGPLAERMRTHPEEALTLSGAARFVGLSSSRLSHLFTLAMGISFKQFQISCRLARADRLMTLHPDWRIARIAAECGFEDPLYFSRVYRRVRGDSPSKARLRF